VKNRLLAYSISSTLLVVLVLSQANPSYAIFGMSKCEKAKAAILSEEKVGKALWETFDTERKHLNPNATYTWGAVQGIASNLTLIYKSDVKVFQIVSKNESCYATKIVASARSQLDLSQKSIQMIDGGFTNLEKENQLDVQLTKSQLKSLIAEYPGYFSFYSWK
jgi:hypothetical protein